MAESSRPQRQDERQSEVQCGVCQAWVPADDEHVVRRAFFDFAVKPPRLMGAFPVCRPCANAAPVHVNLAPDLRGGA